MERVRIPAFKTLLSVCSLIFLPAATAVGNEPPLRALLVCGGCCHDYENQSTTLRDGIQARANVQVDVIRSADNGTKPWFPIYDDPDWAKGYDVIIHDECAADSQDATYVGNILNAHKTGVPAVNLHCAMHSYRTGDGTWFEFLGLQSTSHGWQKPIEIDFSIAKHPITTGLANWTTVDEELYNNVKVFPSATPLALGSQIQGDGSTDTVVVAWTNDYHGTRVFGSTIGHNNATVADDRYLDLIVRGLLWSCDKLNAEFLRPYAGPKGRTTVVPAKTEVAGEAPANATLVTVTTSSVQADNWNWKAVDGNRETRWCAGDASVPQWIQLELDEARPLSGVKIVWESTNNAYRHKIEGSADGNTWETLADATDNGQPGDTTAEFDARPLKFVKITCTGTSQGGWSSIREISAQGEGVGPLFAKLPEAEKKKSVDFYQKSGNSIPRAVTLTPEQEAEILKDVKVADGLDVSLFATADSANYPVFVAAAPNGDLYVASDGNGSLGRDPHRGRIIRLRDTNRDGRADQVTEFVKDVDSPRGLVWDHDRLYLIHPPHVSAFIDHDGDGQADEERRLISGIAFGFEDRPADHTTNGLVMGIDGWLYAAGGDFGFMEAVGSDGRRVQHRNGGVIRFRPDGSGLEIFSTGTRNNVGTPISPLLDLFTRDNTNDGGGWDTRFHHFTGLEDHGYPRMYLNFTDEIIAPLADYGGGSGCGSTYLAEPGFPDEWNNAPLTCDWGTGALWKHTLEPRGATFHETVKPEPMVRMTRPTDACVDGLSGLYQASWKGATFAWEGPNVGYIVRVSPTGYTPEALPDFENASDAELISLLESPSQVRSLEAQRALLRREETPAMADALIALAADSSKPLTARVAAVYALAQRGLAAASAGPVIAKLTPLAKDSSLQRFVLRALGDLGQDQFEAKKPTAPADLFAAGLSAPEPRTRLEAIIGATRQNLVQLAPQIATQLGDPDPVIAHTAVQALSRLMAAEAGFTIIDSAESTSAQRTGALRTLMRIHTPEVVEGLAGRLGTAEYPTPRQELLGALARLYFQEGEWKGDSWGTRPDTRGPYYQPEPWSETPAIAEILKAELAQAGPAETAFMAREMRRNRIELNEPLERLLALAGTDDSLIPQLVDELASAQSTPAGSLPLVLKAARMDGPADLLAKAVAILAKSDLGERGEASLEALERLQGMENAGREREQARKAFLEAPKLENLHQQMEEIAEAMAGPTAVWADAAVLALSARKEGSPESRELSQKALERGWQQAPRRIQILRAIRLTDFRGMDERVLAAASDEDPAVAEAARATASHLKLEPQAPDETPLVSSLTQPEVIAAVRDLTGSAALGEQVYRRQTCVACHAATMDEPQKGPYLGSIAQTYTREDLALAILDPGATIAQGFATELFTLKNGEATMGFVTLESPDEVKIRTITSEEFILKPADIASRQKLPNSLMPPGLADPLTLREFASLLDYLESLSKK